MAPAVRVWTAVWGGWTLLALLFGISTSLTYLSAGRSANWWFNLGRALLEWWLWALLTPFVARLARRFPVSAPSWRRALAVHAVAGTAIALAKTAADRAIVAAMSGVWMSFLASTLAFQVVVYAAIVAGAHGVEYYRRSREREVLERRLADARLQLLNMQLQPHFLFNTLNTIAELVHEDADAADRMITGLADLLRRSLALGGAQEIPLHTELELLATYLDIQRARFGDRLEVRMSVDADARGAQVPMLLLQPIVENAFKHGLAARVDLHVRREGDRLVLEVTDHGSGARDEALRGREGIGLGNTRERLATVYGSAASLDLANVPGRGARVTLRLPIRPVETA